MTSTENNFNCTHAEGPCNDGCLATYSGITHEINMGIESVNGEQVAIFALTPTDNHGNLYRNHENKNTISLNSLIYSKNINVYFTNPFKAIIDKKGKIFYHFDNFLNLNRVVLILNQYFKSVNSKISVNNKGYLKKIYVQADYNQYSLILKNEKIPNTFGSSPNIEYASFNIVPNGFGNVLVYLANIYDTNTNLLGFCFPYSSFPTKDFTKICVNLSYLKNATDKELYLANVITHELTHAFFNDPLINHCNDGDCIFSSGSFDYVNGELKKYNFNFTNSNVKIRYSPWKHLNEVKQIKFKTYIFGRPNWEIKVKK